MHQRDKWVNKSRKGSGFQTSSYIANTAMHGGKIGGPWWWGVGCCSSWGGSSSVMVQSGKVLWQDVVVVIITIFGSEVKINTVDKYKLEEQGERERQAEANCIHFDLCCFTRTADCSPPLCRRRLPVSRRTFSARMFFQKKKRKIDKPSFDDNVVLSDDFVLFTSLSSLSRE